MLNENTKEESANPTNDRVNKEPEMGSKNEALNEPKVSEDTEEANETMKEEPVIESQVSELTEEGVKEAQEQPIEAEASLETVSGENTHEAEVEKPLIESEAINESTQVPTEVTETKNAPESEVIEDSIETSEKEPESPAVNSAALNNDASEDHEEVEESPYKMDEDHDEEVDLTVLNSEQLLELIEAATLQDDLAGAAKIAREVKSLMENIFSEEENAALETFLEDGNEKDDFEAKPNEIKQRFYDAYKKIQARKSDHRQRIEEEKQKNLNIKRRILEDLKGLTENDETSESLDKIKDLQTEWKKIRAVPHEYVQELWDSYRFFLDKFYDNLSINFELKELDRKKNLEAKIDLCLKVDQLQEEASVKVAMNMLNKYHDEWKHTGPVPKEYSEEIWSRFKAASDKIYEQKKSQMDELREMRRKNLELKMALNEKLEQVATLQYEKPKEWIAKTEVINAFFEDWKKIGPVPKEQNDIVWGKFKELRNHFYRQKNNYFKQLNKDKAENLVLKEALCEKALALKESEDWQITTNELIRYQGEWKKIGPVPEKHSDEVWKKFRAACDHFFNKKEEHFKGQKEEQDKNLEVKRALLEEVKALESFAETQSDEVFKKLRDIQKNWNMAGYVPIKFKNQLQKNYSGLVDALYKKHKRNADEMKEGQLQEHYDELATTPDGKRLLQAEERRVREKIRFIKSDLETLENNIGFFSKSKTSGPLIKGIRDKITRANEQVERLQQELRTIKKHY